ncbi:type II secretion system protein GspM [Comamonas badia]|uniref:type II secretion system protein GspM n=1 Tax=Comamonas badia TaxID=265291 RepID=UPI00040E3798|nr:type II secretion system protein GspM [Comamonas badia]
MKTPAALAARWARLAPRERTLVHAAAVLVALALLWWLLLAPPLKALRASPARHAQTNAQWQQMQQLQAQAEQLQGAPRHPGADAPALLRSSVEAAFGASAKTTIAGARATVTLTDAPASAVAAWLAQVRASSQAAPVQAQLSRVGTALPVRWSGSIVLALPTP